MSTPDLAAERLVPTTWEGWFRWAHHQIPKPQSPARGTPAACERYDAARLDYLGKPFVLETPTIRTVMTAVRRLLILNRHATSARRGLILEGLGGTGKSTSVTELGRTHHLSIDLRHPGHDRIPVVYITVPAPATARMIAVEFAHFLALPIRSRANMPDITESVCRTLIDARCDLVIVDEIHNLNINTTHGGEVSDQLKYLSERIPATFIYAGINVRDNLFTGPRGQQLASRFALVPTRPFAYGTAGQRQEWDAMVASFEAALCLRQHRNGTLARHSEYLYTRTNGRIGSLSTLVRGAAIDAILSEKERITRDILDDQLLDHAAENPGAVESSQPA
ncbi:TniB family NTP-binding protein [Paractinoplanes maris]|uniref:TniB family NTP-binding protein n=1 Tax=Paractinoplanes maris TaxID=1734446 RepID=UPI002020FC26|nr:TniB family NTP-binding protein [Actinoplanes maris]